MYNITHVDNIPSGKGERGLNFTEPQTTDLYAWLTGSHPSLLAGCVTELEDLAELRYS